MEGSSHSHQVVLPPLHWIHYENQTMSTPVNPHQGHLPPPHKGRLTPYRQVIQYLHQQLERGIIIIIIIIMIDSVEIYLPKVTAYPSPKPEGVIS